MRACACRYRKPRSSYKYIRPEMNQRHAAFKRGSSYLERYCQLIAFAYYLEHVGHGAIYLAPGVWRGVCLHATPPAPLVCSIMKPAHIHAHS